MEFAANSMGLSVSAFKSLKKTRYFNSQNNKFGRKLHNCQFILLSAQIITNNTLNNSNNSFIGSVEENIVLVHVI
jgi:hypothetical protein